MKKEFPRMYGWCAACLGIGLMIFGVWRGELEILFTKAIHICLECIGIG